MADSQQAPGAPEHDTETDDPEIQALLDFEPAPRMFKRKDGWTPALQRRFIALLAETGSPSLAAAALAKNRYGVEKVYKSAGAEGFRAAWDRAVELFEERAAERLETQNSGAAGIRPPFVDGRRKSARGWDDEPEPEGEPSEDAKLELLESLASRFLKKVVVERQARLAGEIVAADFYLRQITVLEVAFDMMSSEALGRDAWACLKELQRGGHGWQEIADTPFTRYLDDKRRDYWRANGEPMRPVALREEFLEGHGSHRTQIDQHTYGAMTPPARGYSAEEWARMDYDEQRRAREEQFRQDAADQISWEAAARREYEDRRARAAAVDHPPDDRNGCSSS